MYFVLKHIRVILENIIKKRFTKCRYLFLKHIKKHYFNNASPYNLSFKGYFKVGCAISYRSYSLLWVRALSFPSCGRLGSFRPRKTINSGDHKGWPAAKISSHAIVGQWQRTRDSHLRTGCGARGSEEPARRTFRHGVSFCACAG